MTAVSRLWVAVAIAGLAATTSVPRGWYWAAAEARDAGRGKVEVKASASTRVDPEGSASTTGIPAQAVRGGALGIPEYRLPKDILDLEVNLILDLGVKLSTNVTLGRDLTVTSLKEDGFEAIFLGLGAWDSSKMRVANEEIEGVLPGIDFLKQFGLRRAPKLHGTVLVVGGGNTAVDCARTALRLGAAEVRLLYRRTRDEMPANAMEIEEAIHEGVKMDLLVAPSRVLDKDGRVSALECVRMELGERDSSGRRSPKPIRGSEFTVPCDFVIAAIGQSTDPFDGTKEVICAASYAYSDTSFSLPPKAIGCDQTGGTSGGPWILAYGTYYLVNGNMSYRYFGYDQELFSPYFGDYAYALWEALYYSVP